MSTPVVVVLQPNRTVVVSSANSARAVVLDGTTRTAIAQGQAALVATKPQTILAEIGKQGLPGPPGPSGTAGTSVDFVQASPAAVWTINHNLGFQPSVELRTVGGQEFDAEVQHTSLNQTLVYLASPLAGTARLN